MKLVVTDACIFIDIIELQLTAGFFALQQEVHTTRFVIDELYEEQQYILNEYVKSEKLYIHSLSSNQQQEIIDEDFPRALSPEDCSVIYIARKLNAILLSSDKPVRTHAKKLAVEFHGMFWIFDKLVEETVLTKAEATEKLKLLIQSNTIYKGSLEMIKEAEGRFRLWEV